MEISKKLFTFKIGEIGLALARNSSSWYSSSAPVKIVSPFLPSTSILTVLAELGDLPLRFRAGNTDQDRVSSLGKSIRLVHQLQHPRTVLDLIERVQVCVVERAGLPHLPHNFQPALAQGARDAMQGV